VVVAPMIALTATATPRVMAEMARALALVSPTTVIGDFARPNLRFSVQHHRSDERRSHSPQQGSSARATGP